MVMFLDLQSLKAPPLVTTQDTVEVATLKNRIPNVEVPLQFHPSSHTLEFIFVDAGSGFGFGGLKNTASQVTCEDLTTVKAKAPSSNDALPSSSMDSNVSLNLKQQKSTESRHAAQGSQHFRGRRAC